MCTMKIVWYEVLLICAITKISLTQQLGDKQRSKRNTYAGYTQDNDTCKKYNENLNEMWATLSKHINSTETVSEQALHNIAIIIKAYLDHHNSHNQEEVQFRPQIKKDKSSEVLKNIKKVLGTHDATRKVFNIILENYKPNYQDQVLDCRLINEDNLYSSINLLYRNYQENTQCRGDYLTEFMRGNIGGYPLYAQNRRIDSPHVVNDEIVNDSEWTKDFSKSKIPFDHNLQESLIARKAYQSYYWPPDVQIEESCVNYANRKFVVSLGEIIDRFNDLRDCIQDGTLRTDNKKIESDEDEHLVLQVADGECCNQGIKVLAATRAGQPEQSQINNYVNIVKEYKNHEDSNTSKTILVVNGVSYNIPLLLKLKNKTETIDAPLLDNLSHNGEHQENALRTNIALRNNADNDLKTFQESATRERQNKFVFAKPFHMYDILKVRNAINIKNNQIRQNNIRDFLVNLGKKQNKDIVKPLSNINESIGNDNITSNDKPGHATGVSIDTVGEILNDVRNSSLQNVQIDVNSQALKSEKGYVQLSYIVKYPKSIIYRPQYLVKNILPYDDFLKVSSQLYNTDDDQQLIRIVRFLPDKSMQVLFETQEIKSPLEIYNVKEQTLEKSHSRSLLDPDNFESENYIHVNEKETTDGNYSGSLIKQTINNETFNGNISTARKNSTYEEEYTFIDDKTRSVGNFEDDSKTLPLDSDVLNKIGVKKPIPENKYISNLNKTDSDDNVIDRYFNLRNYKDESNEKLKDIDQQDANIKAVRDTESILFSPIDVELDRFIPVLNVSSTIKEANYTNKIKNYIGIDQNDNVNVDKYSISASRSKELPQSKKESQQKDENQRGFENIDTTDVDQIDDIQQVDELRTHFKAFGKGKLMKQKVADENTPDKSNESLTYSGKAEGIQNIEDIKQANSLYRQEMKTDIVRSNEEGKIKTIDQLNSLNGDKIKTNVPQPKVRETISKEIKQSDPVQKVTIDIDNNHSVAIKDDKNINSAEVIQLDEIDTDNEHNVSITNNIMITHMNSTDPIQKYKLKAGVASNDLIKKDELHTGNVDSHVLREHELIPDINLTEFDIPETSADQVIKNNIRMFVTAEEALLVMKEKLFLKDIISTTKRSTPDFDLDYLRVIPTGALESPIIQTDVKNKDSLTEENNSNYKKHHNFLSQEFKSFNRVNNESQLSALEFDLNNNVNSTHQLNSLVEDKDINNKNPLQQDKSETKIEQSKMTLSGKKYGDNSDSNITNGLIPNDHTIKRQVKVTKLPESNQNNKIDSDFYHANPIRTSKVINDKSKRDSSREEEYGTDFNKTHVQKHEGQTAHEQANFINEINVNVDQDDALRAYSDITEIEKPASAEDNIETDYEEAVSKVDKVEGVDKKNNLNKRSSLEKHKAKTSVEERHFLYVTPNIDMDGSQTGFKYQVSDKDETIMIENIINKTSPSGSSQENNVSTEDEQLDTNEYNEDSHSNNNTKNEGDSSTYKLSINIDNVYETLGRKYKMSLNFTQGNSLENYEDITEDGLEEHIGKRENYTELNNSRTPNENVANLHGEANKTTRNRQDIVDTDFLQVDKSFNGNNRIVFQTEDTEGVKPKLLIRQPNQSITPTAKLQENPHNCSNKRAKEKYSRKDEDSTSRKIISSDEKSSDITYLKILPVPKSKENSNENNKIQNLTLRGKPPNFKDNLNIRSTGMSSSQLFGTRKTGDPDVKKSLNTNKGLENLAYITDSPAAASLRKWWGRWRDKLESNVQSIETSFSKLHQDLIDSN